MMNDEGYIRIWAESWDVLWVLMWGAIWFVIFNAAVWFIFDRHFWDWVGFERLLMQPSDNELQSVMHKIKNETGKKHVVLLGDSIVWGVGVNNSAETITGQISQLLKDREDIRVVNLAVPGNSFLDMATQIRGGYRSDDIYLFFINPMLFDEEYANATFDQSVRFKNTVSAALSDERNRFDSCCQLTIPPMTVRSAVTSTVKDFVPLFRQRDSIAKWMLGLQPSIAVDALLHRFLSFRLRTLFERRPMSISGGVTGLRQTQDFGQSRMTRILSNVTDMLTQYSNVFYVIVNDNRFEKNAFQDRNIAIIRDAIHSEKAVSLYKTIGSDLYLDSVHMKPEGHRKVAEKIFEFLLQSNAI